MSTAKIIWAVSFLAAIILAFVHTGNNGLILAVLGLASGWFCSTDDRRGVLIAAIFLAVAAKAMYLSGIPAIGEPLDHIIKMLSKVFGAAGILIIVRTLVERIIPASKD